MREFRYEQRGVALSMGAALAVTLIVSAAVMLGAHERPGQPFAAQLPEVLRAELLVVPWLAAAIANVARLRFFSEQDIAGSGVAGGSDAVRRAGAILQNTVEQVALAMATHLIAAATLDRAAVLVEALAVLFAAGRLLFWIGYKHGARARALGFGLTFYPSVVALGLCAVAQVT